MLPEGKKPLIISFDDVNYYDYMLAEGFTSKLVLGDDGQNPGPVHRSQHRRDLPHPGSGRYPRSWTSSCWSTPTSPSTGPRPSSPSPATRASWATVPRTTSTSPPTIPAAPPLTPTVRRDRGRQAGHRAAQGDRLDLRLPPHLGPHPPGQPPPGVRAAGHRPLGGGGGLPGGPHQHPVLPHGGRPDGDDWHSTGPVFRVLSRARLPHLRQRGHQLLLLHQEGHFRHHDLRPAPPRRHHPAQRQGPGVVQPVLRRAEIMDLDVRPDLGVTW